MKTIAKNRIVIAGLLLFLFVIPFVAKPIHSHHYNKTCTENRQEQHDSDNCLVCQFALSSFIQTELLSSDYLPDFHSVKPIVYLKNTSSGISYPHYLRGPPSI
ncbi:hypothetical protein EZS27_001320 [termite gut metagenome]|uniref:DUF2946 domain-containing protein n=1 Tax=termite gut metagenome TaxID=433724 RepID=A0A5J4SZA9_9ZZZZ